MSMSPRGRFALRIVGYIVLALVTFLFALHLTFPYERVRDQALQALESKYDVTIGGVERSWVPGRFALTAVTLRSRPSVAGQPTTTMYFKKVEIDLGFKALLSGNVKIGLDIATGAGKITGTVVAQKRAIEVDFKLANVPLTMIPGISDAVGLPMAGNSNGKIKMRLVKSVGPRGKVDVDWSKANGVFELSCSVGCTLGDGEAKIYPKSKRPGDDVWVKDGVIVPTLRIGSFKLAIDVVKGQAKRRTFELRSPDGEVDLDVDIKLARAINDSTIAGCIKYKCSKELYDREPKFRSQCDFGSAMLDSAGMHHIKLLGKLGNVRRVAALCDGQATDITGSTNDGPPRLDVPPPPEPIQIIDAGMAPVEPPPPQPEALPPQPMRDDVSKDGVGSGSASPTPPPVVAPPAAVLENPKGLQQGDGLKPNGDVKSNGDVGAPVPSQLP